MALSWRRVFIYGSASVLFAIFVFSLTPITSPLPRYTGPHAVGVLDVETEIQKRTIAKGTLKETGEDAFELSTLAITLYYPSTLPPPSPSQPQPLARPWLPQPISLIGTGYARLANVFFPPFQWLFTFGLWALGSKTVIPGVVNAPLLTSSPDDESLESGSGSQVTGAKVAHQVKEQLELRAEELGIGTLPLVVFTHGMAGMSQSYSHYLGSIASHGYVVAAVEHRDGSGPGTIIHDGNEKEKRRVWHLKLRDIESEPPLSELDLTEAQLAFREAEIHETISLFSRLNAGDTQVHNLKPKSRAGILSTFEGRLNLSAITVIGHSYGATGAIQALNPATSLSKINGGIALDPGKESGPLNHEIDVPLLVLHSGEWTEKQTQFYDQGWHFDVVRKLVSQLNDSWFMTLKGTAHPSCTDAPLIVPWIMRIVTGTTLDARVALDEYIDVSVKFLRYLRDGEKRGVLKSGVTSANGPFEDTDARKFKEGRMGAEWEIHVVPK